MTKKTATIGAEPTILERTAMAGTRKVSSKKETNPIVTLQNPEDNRIVGAMIRLGVISREIDQQFKPHKTTATAILFNDWVHRYWEDQKLPPNIRYVIKQDTGFVDMECMLQVRSRSTGLDTPDLSELPAGTTVQDALIDQLTLGPVGLSNQKAAALVNPVNGEITVDQEIYLADSLNAMVNSDQPVLQMASKKLLEFLNTKGRNGRATVDTLTVEEKSALISVRQAVQIKEGFLERAYLYAETEEQLRNLLIFMGTTIAITGMKFAETVLPPDRVNRLQEVVNEFLGN